MRQLTEAPYLWCVTFESLDDGHRGVAAYFEHRESADAHCKSHTYGNDQRVVQAALWKGDNGRYYEVTMREVLVDQPLLRTRAMAKLSDAERRALGLIK